METLSLKSVLVTGGCGFIGRNLVEELLTRGAAVTVLDLPTANWDRMPQSVTQTKADILDRRALSRAVDTAEIVYHLAARTDLDGTMLADYDVNYTGTSNLIEECALSGQTRRFVFYSTQLVVGLFNEARFIDEREPYRTKTMYGRSKIEGERVVIDRCRRAGIPYTIIRPTSVYGPWGDEPYRGFFRAIKRHRYMHVGRAENLVSWVYVKNLVGLTILASLHPKAENEIYFGNDFHPYTMREIVNAVADSYGIKVPTAPSAVMTAVAYALAVPKHMGLNVPIYPFRLRNIKATYCYDIQKSVSLGYVPEYDLRRGIQETLEWYDSNRLI